MNRNVTRRNLLAAASLAPVLASGIPGALFAEPPEFKPQVVVRRKFPPISNAPVLSAIEANKKIRPNELVLGVEANGEARAYPINMLTGPRREIINDILGRLPIAATW